MANKAKCLTFSFFLLVHVTFCQSLSAFHIKASDDEVTSLLNRYRRFSRENNKCASVIAQSGMAMINSGIKFINPTIKQIDGFYQTLAEVYKTMSEKKEKMKYYIFQRLRLKYPKAADIFMETPGFEEALVFLYTSDLVYPDLNKALRNHDCTHKALGAKDQALAPFAAALMATLMYWREIEPVSKISYRSINLTAAEISTYKIGDSFLWPSFSSSSTSKNIFKLFPGNAHFIIDNSGPSSFRPRNIKMYSALAKENEVLYPPCASFRITKKSYDVKNNALEIHLSLLQGLHQDIESKTEQSCINKAIRPRSDYLS